jgi:hypothetical protein
MFIRKIMPGDIVDVAEHTEDPYDSDYFIYPNPGIDYLHINSARKGVKLKIFNTAGNLVSTHNLAEGFGRQITTGHLEAGMYILHFTDREGFSEKLSWIKK